MTIRVSLNIKTRDRKGAGHCRRNCLVCPAPCAKHGQYIHGGPEAKTIAIAVMTAAVLAKGDGDS